MKIKIEEHKQRVSLLLLFSAVVLAFLILTTIMVGLIVILIINSKLIDPEMNTLNVGAFLLILTLCSIVIGAILAFVTLRFPLKPVNEILNAMNHLASGDYSVRLKFKGILAKHPTVAELTDSFNKMAAELQQTEMLRSDFVNNFSHEFKTPIVSIAGFTKLLKRGNLSEEQKKEYLDIVEEESLRLSQMATNVLNLAKIENQAILTDTRMFNLSEQIRTCVLALEGKWNKKSIELLLPSEEFHIVGNEELLKMVWINLLDNAIKFSPDYGVVEICIFEKDEMTYVSFSNFGDEIPANAKEKIFNKFYQVDESHSTMGNGIGLAIVKKIVDLHKGSIRVDCKNGKTIFAVSLPNNIQ